MARIKKDRYLAIKRDKNIIIRYFSGLVPAKALSYLKFDCPFCHGGVKKYKDTGSIYEHEGIWFYKCWAGSCGMIGDIVTIISKNEGLEGRELSAHIEYLFGESEFSNLKNLETISGNRKLIQYLIKESAPQGRNKHPKCIYGIEPSWFYEFLLKTLDLAELKIMNADEIFTAALCEFGGKGEVHKLYLCRLAGLIELADIPVALLKTQLAYQKKTGNRNLISAHYVPKWTPELIKSAIQTINKAIEFGITTMKCTKGQIEAVFGHEALERVYHGITNRKAPRPAPEALKSIDEKAADQLTTEIENMNQTQPKIDPWESFAILRDQLAEIEKALKPLNKIIKSKKNVTFEIVDKVKELRNRKSTLEIEMENVRIPFERCSDEELRIRIDNHYNRSKSKSLAF